MEKAEAIIARLGLVPHPEGGHYREVHRSGRSLGVPPGYPGERSALTAIYFLLAQGEFSAFHGVRGEEVWVHLAGAPLELVLLDEAPEVRAVGSADEGHEPLTVVAGGCLQAARSLGPWTLVTCLVAPAFTFADFEMPDRRELLDRYPGLADLIRSFTR